MCGGRSSGRRPPGEIQSFRGKRREPNSHRARLTSHGTHCDYCAAGPWARLLGGFLVRGRHRAIFGQCRLNEFWGASRWRTGWRDCATERRIRFLVREERASVSRNSLSIYGSQRASIHAIPSGSFVTSYSERPTVTLTPGLRVRWAGTRRISPWAAFGGGMARIDRTGTIFDAGRHSATQSDIKFVPALAPAAGADIRLRGRWFLRGEFRAFLYRTPGVGFVASEFDWNQWHSNPTGIVSFVYRR